MVPHLRVHVAIIACILSLSTAARYRERPKRLDEAAVPKTWTPGLPEGWGACPYFIKDFPETGPNVFEVNPWSYHFRLCAYKTLLESTRDYIGFRDGWGNPLWGLALQFAWQQSTNRLLNGDGEDAINPDSWWGGMNYFLSVIPFVSALEAGCITIPPGATVKITPHPTGVKYFCVSYSDCLDIAPLATKQWKLYFDDVRKGGMNASEATAGLWLAHVQSLHEGLVLNEPLLSKLPSKAEAEFGSHWAQLVDFVAAMQVDVDFNATNALQAEVVPPRLLRDNDVAPFIADFTGPQNRALLSSALLYNANQQSKNFVLDLFNRLCCTPEGRDAAYEAFVGFLSNPVADVTSLIRLLEQLVNSHRCPT